MEKKVKAAVKAKTTTAKTKKAPAKKENKSAAAVKKLELLVTVVNRSKAEYYMDLIQNHEVNMQMALPAKGTANAETLKLLGLAGSEKAVILSAVREDKVKELLAELGEKFVSIRNGSGIAYTIPMSSVIGVAVYGFLSNNKQTVKG